MQKKTSFKSGVVDLNQRLKLTNLKTTQYIGKQKKDVKNPKLFLPVSCNFNFNDDHIEFMLDIHNDELKNIKIQKPTVHFKFSNLRPVTVPIISNQQNKEGSVSTVIIKADIKDRLLHLFQTDQKEFLLTVLYTDKHKKKYASLFSVSLPKIDNQNERPVERKFIEDYNPEDFKYGLELKKLFESNFVQYPGITHNELETLTKIKCYESATVADRFSKFDFLTMFQNMIAIEDMECIKEIHGHSLDFAKIIRYNNCQEDMKKVIKKQLGDIMDDEDYARKIHVIKGKKKIAVDDMDFCAVYIYEQSDYKTFQNDCKKLVSLRMDGKIEHLFDDIILVKIFRSKGTKKQSSIRLTNSYHVEFVPNRVSIRTAQRAVEDMKSMDMQAYLQNFETKNVLYRGSKEKFENLDWFSTSITTNEEQMLAVKNIVNCTSFPSPFIIFGGPGTGKSTTIVEAIAQIVKMKPDSHVLFTAGSNSTCDDIGNRLAKYVSVNKILRIYSPSFDQKQEKIDKFLRDISNFRRLGNSRGCSSKDPSYKEFMTARVIIVTIVSAGRIISAGYPSDHFDYIFIDEAGFVSEPESYIPLSGLGLSKKGVHAQVVLAGDHKQLRPVVTNSLAQEMGLETSLMERLMDNDKKYKRSTTNGYDQNFVVQLKQNYRNHPAIMRFSNENFYDSQLVSMRTDRLKHLLITNEEFPIIFHANKSLSEKVGTSLKNEGELLLLNFYISVLLKKGSGKHHVEQSDIGIISPYSAQRNRMIEMFGKKYSKIEIGTVDSFQGREKKIIFVSCVRSGTSHVGFLSNEKRLNVALTRAQSMLVVIGNIETLQKSEIWHKFITYCHENKATVGDLKNFDRKKVVDKNNLSKEDIIDLLRNLRLN